MIDCPRCHKENQDHYKFCLGCGGELPRDSNRPKSFSVPTPSASTAFGSSPAAATVPDPIGATHAAARSSSSEVEGSAGRSETSVPCPTCEAKVPLNFRFCHVCGHDLNPTRPPANGSSQANGTSSRWDSSPQLSFDEPVAVQEPAPQLSFEEPVAVQEPAPQPHRGPEPSASAVRLILIQPDGREGDAFELAGTTTVIGRASGGVFGKDAYMSPEHAEFEFDGSQLVVRDLESLNGIYIRIETDVPVELFDGSVFRIGQEILCYEGPTAREPSADDTQWMGSPHSGMLGRIRLVVGRNSYGNSFPIPPHGIHLGRERGDVNFPEDGYVSGLHCRVHSEVGHIFLTDVGSSNGTFVRVRGESYVPSGGYMLMGQQLFRAEY